MGGNIQHIIAVVIFENWAAQNEKPYDENRSSDDWKRGLSHEGKHDSQLGALWNSSQMICDGGTEQPELTELTREKGGVEALAGCARNETRSWEGSDIRQRHSKR